MRDCPLYLSPLDDPPDDFIDYPHNAKIFHCGYRGIVESRGACPEDPCQECFYDSEGFLISSGGCEGTPNSYDDPLRHAFVDPGGILKRGLRAFLASILMR